MAKRRTKKTSRKASARPKRRTSTKARVTRAKTKRARGRHKITGPRPIPEGHRTVTPYLTVRGAGSAIDFYKRAFGADELSRMPSPDGKIMHAELRIGDCIVFLSDEFEGSTSRSPLALGGSSSHVHLYVLDVDKAFQRAVGAGATVRMPVQDMFWGDRYGRVTDPFGHDWGLATHKEDLTPAQIAQRAAAAFSSPPA